jgi:hypothetical protein
MDRKKQQVPPLRFAPVPRHAGTGGMTNSFKTRGVYVKSIKSQPLRMTILWELDENILNKLALMGHGPG